MRRRASIIRNRARALLAFLQVLFACVRRQRICLWRTTAWLCFKYDISCVTRYSLRVCSFLALAMAGIDHTFRTNNSRAGLDDSVGRIRSYSSYHMEYKLLNYKILLLQYRAIATIDTTKILQQLQRLLLLLCTTSTTVHRIELGNLTGVKTYQQAN